MSASLLSSETLHASCVAKDGRAVLISGRSGSGKSDLALRLVDRGAVLVSDDYTVVRRVSGRLLARAPANIEGRMEVRGLGILPFPHESDMPVCLFVDLNLEVVRMPEPREPIWIAGVQVPVVALNALEASAPIKVEVALRLFGLPPG
ncbi:MAG TPA: HPr kinase/phosphatase C-terminal domain-containing protein [Allosphingosinicella sp.]|jgi:serine kinase of HPr protein (carbohydrate metabolism regulator)|uniref:HPr kinase/phosphorylase n=1 Tax=Allosphingosinicella sp. TaxID=2823234 RepID=UPI002F2A6592